MPKYKICGYGGFRVPLRRLALPTRRLKFLRTVLKEFRGAINLTILPDNEEGMWVWRWCAWMAKRGFMDVVQLDRDNWGVVVTLLGERASRMAVIARNMPSTLGAKRPAKGKKWKRPKPGDRFYQKRRRLEEWEREEARCLKRQKRGSRKRYRRRSTSI